MSKANGLHIAIEGVIGSGKTTLAHALADKLGAIRLFESDIENPYLERFYKNKDKHALACQMWFLQARVRQFSNNLPSGMPAVADHSLVKERIFASINLSDDEFTLYQQFAELMMPLATFEPDVTIYLKADLGELSKRISKRGLPMEYAIEKTYLSELINAYEQYYADVQHERVLVVSTDSVNIAENEAALEHLIKACMEAGPGLSYCNPVS